ncbi:proton-conducting transporter membrane subunit [Cryobacterium sp. N19]|uniref:proton-conducting transporter transmembrane domain-containing protein n=1 Tax=Cryobacterium sp. N19 TaxID=2048288 RepID=UPI000CE30139|nr:proton-conducting transporter membrane subunit [Cryobacterium sp. N19]
MNGNQLNQPAEVVARLVAVVMGVGFLVTVVAIPVIFSSGSLRVGIQRSTLQVDGLAVVLSALVLGLSALIQSFAIRYLRGDSRQLWFVAASALLTGFTVLMVCAGSVAVFAVGWIGAGAALVLLLGTYFPLAQARRGKRATAVRFILADAAFVSAVVVLLVAGGGDLSWARLGAVVTGLPVPVQVIVAGLLTTGAFARSSQIPFHGWLPFTLAAPTPVSALMHAGVVNAGAILLFRFAPAIALHASVMTIVFLVGATTLTYAAAVRLVRADVKGRLVFSTMGQMGFMIMACGLGLFAAAIFHLIAHSLFKSALFLGAGAGITQHTVSRDLPDPKPRTRVSYGIAVAVGVLVPGGTLLAAKLVLAPTASAATIGLLGFVSLTASVALASALITHFTLRTFVSGVGATVLLLVGYVAFLHTFTAALQPVFSITAAPAWLLLLPGLSLLGVQLLASTQCLTGFRNLVYARAVTTTVSRPPSVQRVVS